MVSTLGGSAVTPACSMLTATVSWVLGAGCWMVVVVMVASRTANCWSDTAKNRATGGAADTAESRDAPPREIYTTRRQSSRLWSEMDERFSGFHDCETLIAAEVRKEGGGDRQQQLPTVRMVNPDTAGNTSSTEGCVCVRAPVYCAKGTLTDS